MKSRGINCLLWALTMVVGLCADEFTCDVTESGTQGGVQMPTVTIDSDSYQTHVEVNILDKNYSLVVDEYLDFDGNRARLDIFKAGAKESIFYSFPTDEVFDIKYDMLVAQTCTVYTLENDPYKNMFGFAVNTPTDPDKRHAFGSAAFLRFSGNSSDFFQGTATVRGIPTNVWSACIDYPGAQGKIKASYYFTPRGWNTSSPMQQMPVRIEVEGLSVSTGPGPTPAGPVTPRHFHHIYDFISYLPYVDIYPTLFETPPDVICPNRKRTELIPSISPYFRYRAEVVNPDNTQVSHYSVWYDDTVKLFREETSGATLKMYREEVSGTEAPPDPSDSERITEIHDFNTGMRYVKKADGTCTIAPIEMTAADAVDETSSGQFTGSYSLDMKGPNNFFRANDNYTFMGTRTVRGIGCDIFSNIVPNYEVNGLYFNATFEYAFLTSSVWTDIPEDGVQGDIPAYPIQLVISIPEFIYTRIYNFFDYAEEQASFSHFDVSSCFDDSQKIGFRLILPGVFFPGTEEVWIEEAHKTLYEIMTVFPLRVGGVTVTHDVDTVYVDAYVLGTSYLAHFEKAAVNQPEYADDKVVKSVTVADDCAYLCLTNTDFTCDGFQFCPDDGNACRLSKTHGATRTALANGTSCADYTRTVQAPTKQMLLVGDAYKRLSSAVRQGAVAVTIPRPGGAEPPDFFLATDIDITSALPVAYKRMPSMPSMFFYRLETVQPNTNVVLESFVWFTGPGGMVRYDTRDVAREDAPTTTRIHDFLNGIAFNINKVTEECTITSIPNKAIFDVGTGDFFRDVNGSFIIGMNKPSGLFFLDNSYTYVGQDTVRGILCDVYESWRTDFDLEYYNISNAQTVFKYYFQTENWDYYSVEGEQDTTQKQPVQLVIEDRTQHSSLIYNYYDITERDFDSTTYDPTVCFGDDQRLDIVIIFKDQPYHPVLDELSDKFVFKVNVQMSVATNLPLIRFQRSSVSYDEDDTYFIGTMLGNFPALALYTPTFRVTQNKTITRDHMTVGSATECAAACDVAVHPNPYWSCHSFDFCPDVPDGPNCLISDSHEEDEGDRVSPSGPCTHYSRTEDDVFETISVDDAYQRIVDMVYDNKFVITMIFPNATTFSYTATDVRNDILLPSDPQSSAGSTLRKFAVTRGYHLDDKNIAVTHSGISITDCAEMCLQENTFDCEAFDYTFAVVGKCRLSAIHPDESDGTSGFATDRNSNVYAKLYTVDYTEYPEQVFKTTADKVVPGINGDEMCARECTDNADFECESFEICSDNTCLLRKTHILAAAPEDLAQNLECSHYSRNHLFDYIERKQQVIDGHDDSIVTAEDKAECAQLCASGDGLPSCASFEMCEKQRGEVTCTFSTADPTVQKDITISNSMECSLFTKANPTPIVNPTAGQTTRAPGKNTVTTGTTTRRTTAKPTTQKPIVTNKPATDKPTGTTASHPCRPTGLPLAAPPAESDTGARVGIGFGSVAIGVIVGIASTLLVIRWRQRREVGEDQHQLQTWSESS